jgi:hypothetical protein
MKQEIPILHLAFNLTKFAIGVDLPSEIELDHPIVCFDNPPKQNVSMKSSVQRLFEAGARSVETSNAEFHGPTNLTKSTQQSDFYS